MNRHPNTKVHGEGISKPCTTPYLRKKLNKTENARGPKLSQSSRKTSESYKTRGNAFGKTFERLFFGTFPVSFRTIFGKFENQQKTLGK